MAQVVLGGIGGAIGGGIGRMVGATLGGVLDRSVLGSLEPARQKGPRLQTLALQGAAEGAPMACAFGRARVTGHVIWAGRFLEGRKTSAGGKGGGGSTEYDYSLSFAVALCEGPIDGIGRIWADGQLMDLAGVTMRLHRGSATQTPDALIEAIEQEAPAYRGTAYVVFEDLPLGPFGNRAPQLSFEIFRRPQGSEPRLEERLEGVCLIPGAGEFVFATEPVLRREGLTRTTPENSHADSARTDLMVSLDQLQVHAPNLKRVSLVIGWFGDDLRAGQMTVRPGVERRDKPTSPMRWSVAGLERGDAHLISQAGGAPAYGGTPSDDSVRQAVAELKARGLEVTLYPFIFMDIPSENDLPDPYGGARQAAYPWRGRIKGRSGTDAGADVAAAFGEANGWGLRRIALHYASLVAETGAHGLLIGSEMRGLTHTRNETGAFPAVAAFRDLAVECRAVVGADVKLSYAADWSEYFGWQDGSEVLFHLDPLWADPEIDYVGIDWYPPISDWREGAGGLDAGAFTASDDPVALAAQVAGGEGFDWFYRSESDRANQLRSPILDTAYGEDWVFRPKDLKSWWSQAHHDRPSGVRVESPTAWTPGMKPIRLVEFGCPAVDRGGNAPNLFQDPKSTENGLPPHSTGDRNDRTQRRALEAVLAHFSDPGNNPVSGSYDGRMLEAADAWCWDARPWPAFPGRADVWADANAWRTGHWLNGRLGGETRDLIAQILKRGGLAEEAFEIGAPEGEVQGYVIDRPMRTRDALEPLLAGLGMVLTERNGRTLVLGRETPGRTLAEEGLALPDDGPGMKVERVLEARPTAIRVRFIDGAADYQTGSAVVRADDGLAGGVDLDLPAVCSRALAEAAANRMLHGRRDDRLMVAMSPIDALLSEPGDTVSIEGHPGEWRIMRVEMDEGPSALLQSAPQAGSGPDTDIPAAGDPPPPAGSPFFRMIDPPPLPDGEGDARPVAVVAGDPWRSMHVFAGADALSLRPRGEVSQSATVGSLVGAVGGGVRDRWDEVNVLDVRVEGRPPQSLSVAAVLAGANRLLLETAAGWEVLQFRSATLLGGDVWRLTGLLRGQQGTEQAMAAGAGEGALLVFLGPEVQRVDSPLTERGLSRLWRVASVGAPAGGPGVGEVVFTTTGLHDRPWRPAHLRAAARSDGGFELGWIARVRIGGDRWDIEPAAVDPPRFRVSVRNLDALVRQFEVEGMTALYAGSDVAMDFPDGLVAAQVAVAQWSESFGWGAEAVRKLV